jgi:hypothetical protein
LFWDFVIIIGTWAAGNVAESIKEMTKTKSSKKAEKRYLAMDGCKNFIFIQTPFFWNLIRRF